MAEGACEVWFYHLERTGLDQALPELLDKTLQRGGRRGLPWGALDWEWTGHTQDTHARTTKHNGSTLYLTTVAIEMIQYDHHA